MTDAVSSRGDGPGSGGGDKAGPAGADHMRASDADREKVAEQLREAVAEGRLDLDEFQERLDATYQARTYGELVPITRDLPVAAAPKVSMTKSGGPVEADGGWGPRIGGEPTSSGAFAFWGGFSRKGKWTVPRLFTAFAMWGGGEIDLRDARFEGRDVTIRCFAIMGGMQVTVPPDLQVDVTGFGIMGGFGEHGSLDGDPDPAAPRVRVTGFALMGGVGVERKLRRADKRALRERRRSERDAWREQRRDERDARREQWREERDARRERRHGERDVRRGGRRELEGRPVRDAVREAWEDRWRQDERERHRD